MTGEVNFFSFSKGQLPAAFQKDFLSRAFGLFILRLFILFGAQAMDKTT